MIAPAAVRSAAGKQITWCGWRRGECGNVCHYHRNIVHQSTPDTALRANINIALNFQLEEYCLYLKPVYVCMVQWCMYHFKGERRNEIFAMH